MSWIQSGFPLLKKEIPFDHQGGYIGGYGTVHGSKPCKAVVKRRIWQDCIRKVAVFNLVNLNNYDQKDQII